MVLGLRQNAQWQRASVRARRRVAHVCKCAVEAQFARVFEKIKKTAPPELSDDVQQLYDLFSLENERRVEEYQRSKGREEDLTRTVEVLKGALEVSQQKDDEVTPELRGRIEDLSRENQGLNREIQGLNREIQGVREGKEQTVVMYKTLLKMLQDRLITALCDYQESTGRTMQRVLLEQFEVRNGVPVHRYGRQGGWQKFLSQINTASHKELQVCFDAPPRTFATQAAKVAQEVNTNVHTVQFQRGLRGGYELMVMTSSKPAQCLISAIAREVVPGAKIIFYDGGVDAASYVQEIFSEATAADDAASARVTVEPAARSQL